MSSRAGGRTTRASTAAATNKPNKPLAMLGLRNSNNENNVPRQNVTGKGAVLALVAGGGGLKDASNKQGGGGLKRKADLLLDNNVVAKKRSVLGDVTNAIEKTLNQGRKEVQKLSLSKKSSVVNKQTISSLAKQSNNATKPPVASKNKGLAPTTGRLASVIALPKVTIGHASSTTVAPLLAPLAKPEEDDENQLAADISYCEALPSSQELKQLLDVSSYVTASETSPVSSQLAKASLDSVLEEEEVGSVVSSSTARLGRAPIPADVEDYDKECEMDPFAVALYANDIFDYYKQRENAFVIEKYLDRQPEITDPMRSILVDWMVEVQESFELNHETLYLAVKLMDLYLSKVVIPRDQLQLVGSTALFIACKFDERVPPYVDDFLYICDDAYKRKELIAYEIKMLKAINYDLGIPLSYRYLRRYARCAKVSMEELTLARYILETSLMEYSLLDASDCAMAAAALLLARCMSRPTEKLNDQWTPTLQHYSGMSVSDVLHLVHVLHDMLTQQEKEHLKTVRNKYSHEVFYEVAKIPVPESLNL